MIKIVKIVTAIILTIFVYIILFILGLYGIHLFFMHLDIVIYLIIGIAAIPILSEMSEVFYPAVKGVYNWIYEFIK